VGGQAARQAKKDGVGMKELLRTNDPVFLSFIVALLKDERIEAIELDMHTAVLEGSISAIQRRLMVADDDYDDACRVLSESGHPPSEE
jgi:hypothetical protein